MANDMAKRLVARVKEFRKTLGLSQEAFAEHAGMDYKYYQQVEAGRKRDLRFSTLVKLAKACGLEPWELLNFEAAPPAVAEDPADYGSKATDIKAPRKAAKRTAVKKGV